MTEPCLCGSPDCLRCFPSQRSRKLAEALSPEDYAAEGYGSCPVCRGWQVDGKPMLYGDGELTQRMNCSDCEATWTDVYRLEGYIDLDVSH